MTTNADLFGAPEPAAVDTHPHTPNVWEIAARQKLGKPPEWRWFSLRVVGDAHDTEVRGDIPLGVMPSGRVVWPKGKGQMCIVSDAEAKAARAAWEREHDQCSHCAGSGEELASASIHGNTYRQCTVCHGTGKPTPGAAEVAQNG